MPRRSGKCIERPRTSTCGSATGDHRLSTDVCGGELVMDARGRPVAFERSERELALDAVVLRERTARMKTAAGRWAGEVGRRSGDGRERLPHVVDVRHGAQEAERVRVPRLAEHLLDAPGF